MFLLLLTQESKTPLRERASERAGGRERAAKSPFFLPPYKGSVQRKEQRFERAQNSHCCRHRHCCRFLSPRSPPPPPLHLLLSKAQTVQVTHCFSLPPPPLLFLSRSLSLSLSLSHSLSLSLSLFLSLSLLRGGEYVPILPSSAFLIPFYPLRLIFHPFLSRAISHPPCSCSRSPSPSPFSLTHTHAQGFSSAIRCSAGPYSMARFLIHPSPPLPLFGTEEAGPRRNQLPPTPSASTLLSCAPPFIIRIHQSMEFGLQRTLNSKPLRLPPHRP